jgi:predicted ribonuclease YlaK
MTNAYKFIELYKKVILYDLGHSMTDKRVKENIFEGKNSYKRQVDKIDFVAGDSFKISDEDVVTSEERVKIAKACESLLRECNHQQKRVVGIIAELMKHQALVRRSISGVSIQGGGGTGKSYIIKLLTGVCIFAAI